MDTTEPREVRLGHVFVRLADNLVRDFDIVELLDDLVNSCVSLFDIAAAGLVLADAGDRLRVLAATSEETRLLELFELQNEQGPCLDCYRTGAQVSEPSAAAQARRWPVMAKGLRALGLGAVHAVPLRLREQTVGALNLFGVSASPLPQDDLQVAQALADVATISLLQHRAAEANERLATQLQTALNSRIAIEQAKGVIAQYASVDMDLAFKRLREHARRTQQALTEVAAAVATGRIPASAVVAGADR
ncbi:GAF and ANTAR domain-containing protein [Nocardioides humi]|uniref:GAF and ANTAR domain-containing protein n=1 Tax=Nocardioides humi TaxID=449461 RepID=A0ABN2BJK5_9ACTN|nr:GAF and ANTAR domain-containing protein [Nocardioides humi]